MPRPASTADSGANRPEPPTPVREWLGTPTRRDSSGLFAQLSCRVFDHGDLSLPESVERARVHVQDTEHPSIAHDGRHDLRSRVDVASDVTDPHTPSPIGMRSCSVEVP